MCVDVKGNLWATGPGGVLIISPKGKLLGRILLGKATANCTFGGEGRRHNSEGLPIEEYFSGIGRFCNAPQARVKCTEFQAAVSVPALNIS